MTRAAWCSGAAALALVALLGSGASHAAQDPSVPAGRRLTAAPDRRVELDFQHYYTTREISLALSALATAYPEFLRLESIGKSRSGADLWVMTVGEVRSPDIDARPAVFLGASLGASDLQGAELALYALCELVQNHARDERVATLLREGVLYVAPCLHPDLRLAAFQAFDAGQDVAAVTARGVDLDRNFPIGWIPAAARDGGPYPLSEPETQAVAAFLLRHPNVGAALAFGPEVDRLRTDPGLALAAADRTVCERLLADPELATVRAGALLGGAGSLLDFCYGQLGAFTFVARAGVLDPASGVAMPPVTELALLGRRSTQATLRLSAMLPRLALGDAAVQRLKNDLWQVEFDVINSGAMPTESALGAERFAAPPPRITTTGAKVLAAAVQRPGESEFRAEGRAGAELRLPELAGGAKLRVRLVVQGAAESTIAVALESPRAGRHSAQIALR